MRARDDMNEPAVLPQEPARAARRPRDLSVHRYPNIARIEFDAAKLRRRNANDCVAMRVKIERLPNRVRGRFEAVASSADQLLRAEVDALPDFVTHVTLGVTAAVERETQAFLGCPA